MARIQPSEGTPEPEPPFTPRPLNSRNARPLASIFEAPTSGDIAWREIETLSVALGGSVTQGRGSRVRVALGPRKAVFHKPHPDKVTDKGAVRGVRAFLDELEIRP